MGEWFRSKDMEFVSLIMNEDAAHKCIRELGRKGCIEFSDLNSELTAYQRRFVYCVKRCDELERKLRFFAGEIKKFGLPLQPCSHNVFLKNSVEEPATVLLGRVEDELEKHETELKELILFNEKLTTEFNEKIELQEVLFKSRYFFEVFEPKFSALNENAPNPLYDVEKMAEIQSRDEMEIKFMFMTGVLLVDDKLRFERALFRSTRGNCVSYFEPIKEPLIDPVTRTLVQKEVFMIMYRSKVIGSKIHRICQAFGAKRYEVPEPSNLSAFNDISSGNLAEIEDSRQILLKNRDRRLSLCTDLAKSMEGWLWTVLCEKAVYHTLNLFDAEIPGMLRAEGWVIAQQLDSVQEIVTQAHMDLDIGGSSILEPVLKPWPTPPTYFETNDFTYAYQELVDTYGIPRYKEANPALFTAVTFPFLFGMMYGDLGHGAFLTLAGLYLISSYKPNQRNVGSEMMNGLYSCRYMIFMMGCFAVYAGLIYNDFCSIALNLFGSKWTWQNGTDTLSGTEADSACSFSSNMRLEDDDCIYPFGVDPAWHISENEGLTFFNSMKMKMSVIIGITQMIVGICLRGLNAIHFNNKLDFFFEFVPMIIFAVSLFGYMIVVIFVKWSIDWPHRMYMATCNEGNDHWPSCNENPDDYDTADLCPLDYGGTGDGCQPPNLITSLIGIALSPGSVDEPLFEGQATTHLILLLVAFGSVPFLLLGKPLCIKFGIGGGHGREIPLGDIELSVSSSIDSTMDLLQMIPQHDEHDFTEIVIHQCIETIEFVLGMVSNTASYLRLWALSLAHSELASVFWSKAMLATLETNPLFLVAGYAVFASVTFAVLLCMDVLECFLHALRLHWVEFQNKFYKADGRKFRPFSLDAILMAAS